MKLLLDTHVLIWLVEGLDELRLEPRQAIEAASCTGGIAVSSVTFWEVAMLAARGRIHLRRPAAVWRDEVLALPGVSEIPLSGDVAVEAVHLPGSFHADPADRFLVATARAHGMHLVTRDSRIIAYGDAGHVATVPV